MIEIPLSNGQVTLVDDEDYPLVKPYTWYYNAAGTGYAMARVEGRKVFLHRFLMGEPDYAVDHINGNTLDNRRANLEPLDHEMLNVRKPKRQGTSSQYRGVSISRSRMSEGRAMWRADIRYKGGLRFLGYFYEEIEAAIAYDEAAIELRGRDANLNFPITWGRDDGK